MDLDDAYGMLANSRIRLIRCLPSREGVAWSSKLRRIPCAEEEVQKSVGRKYVKDEARVIRRMRDESSHSCRISPGAAVGPLDHQGGPYAVAAQ